jgi:acyl carrier protein
LNPDGVYLITGGLTGLGLETAGWLIRCGAKHMVLAGRRAPGPKAREAIETWTNAGIRIASVQADIGDDDGAERIFAAVRSLEVPLRGVFHSAGVLDDAALLQQDWSRFETVLRAKVQGGWNLHLHTLSVPLDFFVLYSSGAAIFGAKGQANHATANAFLDGLARYRVALGLPALSINWGPWRETGSATRREVIDHLERSGLDSIDTANGLRAIECILAAGCTQAAVLPINWEKFAGGSDLFTGLAAEGRPAVAPVENAAVTARVWQGRLEAAGTLADLRAILQQMIGSEAARILGIKSSQAIDPRQPLQELGLDSLMAVQLRNTLATLAGVELAATLLFNYPSVDQLVEHLASCLAESGDAAPAQPAAEAVEGAADLDDLTEDELVRLLEEQIHLT